jgi:hypothetical protein
METFKNQPEILIQKRHIEIKKASAFEEALADIKRAMSLFTPTAEASHGPEINSFFISKVVSKLHIFCHHQYSGFSSMIVSITMKFIFISFQKDIFNYLRKINLSSAFAIFFFGMDVSIYAIFFI